MSLHADVREVLIADPQPASAAGIASRLHQSSCAVTVVATLEEAESYLQDHRPQLFLCEAFFPQGAPLRLFRNVTIGGRRILLIMTGRSPTRELVLRSIRAGAVDFLVKPLSPEAAFRRIAAASQLVFGGGDEGGPADGLTPPERVRRAVQRASSSLALPHAVARVIQLSSSPDAGAQDFVAPCEADPSIASALLRLANSAFFARPGGTTRIRDAVVRLGFRNVRNTVLTLSVFKLLPGGAEETSTFHRLGYWMHALGTAIVARRLARPVASVQTDDAFVGGLLHDIGKPILDDYAPYDFHRAIRASLTQHRPLYQAEAEIFGVNHAQVGGAVLTQWKLPDDIIDAVLRHHTLEDPGERDRRKADPPTLADVVWLGNKLAKALLLGHSGDSLVTELDEATLERLPVRPLLDDPGLPEEIAGEMREYFTLLNLAGALAQAAPFKPLPAVRFVRRSTHSPLLGVFLRAMGCEEISDPDGGPFLLVEDAPAGTRLSLQGVADASLDLTLENSYDLLDLHHQLSEALETKGVS